MDQPHIFIGLENIAGYASMLQKGFIKLGIECDLFTRSAHNFEYQAINQNPVVSLFQRVFRLYKNLYQSNSKMLKSIGYLFDILAITPFFIYTLFKYNVFIFTYKSSFYRHLGYIDLPILRWFKKKLIFVFHGSDARPPYVNGAFLSKRGIIGKNTLNADAKHLKVIKRRTYKWKKDILTIERYADVIINNPPTSHFHEKPIVSFLRVGIPYEGKSIKPPDSLENNEKIKILHSPSNPTAKGSGIIRKAIQSLQTKGYPIQYSEVINQPNQVVLKKLAACDFIVDQMYSDTPMPGFVTEAAAFGKAAVICGYSYKQISAQLPPEMLPPSHYRHPDDIETSIEKLIVDKRYRNFLGQKARKFVQNQWHPKKVAERYLKLIHKQAPSEWSYDPLSIYDVHGACVSEADTRKWLKSFVQAYGKEALCLQDKPDLEELFVQFAYSK